MITSIMKSNYLCQKKKKSGSVVCPQCEHFCQCIFAIHNSTAYKGLGGKIHSS